jgi:hypothetical protein
VVEETLDFACLVPARSKRAQFDAQLVERRFSA